MLGTLLAPFPLCAPSQQSHFTNTPRGRTKLPAISSQTCLRSQSNNFAEQKLSESLVSPLLIVRSPGGCNFSHCKRFSRGGAGSLSARHVNPPETATCASGLVFLRLLKVNSERRRQVQHGQTRFLSVLSSPILHPM